MQQKWVFLYQKSLLTDSFHLLDQNNKPFSKRSTTEQTVCWCSRCM